MSFTLVRGCEDRQNSHTKVEEDMYIMLYGLNTVSHTDVICETVVIITYGSLMT